MEPEQLLGLALVHRERRREHVGAGVRDAEQLEHALHAAVLAHPAVQRHERDVGMLLAERDVEVAVDVDRDDVVAALASAASTASPVRSETSRSLDKPPSKTPIFRDCIVPLLCCVNVARIPLVFRTVRGADPAGKFWAA